MRTADRCKHQRVRVQVDLPHQHVVVDHGSSSFMASRLALIRNAFAAS
jgi:hypothetical protein